MDSRVGVAPRLGDNIDWSTSDYTSQRPQVPGIKSVTTDPAQSSGRRQGANIVFLTFLPAVAG
jgi:hypothetical protein